jgi:hypothetical protein
MKVGYEIPAWCACTLGGDRDYKVDLRLPAWRPWRPVVEFTCLRCGAKVSHLFPATVKVTISGGASK